MAEKSRALDGRFAPDEPPSCPSDHPHNTWCYSSHGCKCGDCRSAWAAARRKIYRKSRVRKSEPVLIGAAPIVRRLRALAVIGYSLVELSEIMDVNRGNLAEIRRGERPTVRITTARKVVDAYRKLWMNPSAHPQAKLVAERARQMRYHSPLHWADIDKGIADDDSGDY